VYNSHTEPAASASAKAQVCLVDHLADVIFAVLSCTISLKYSFTAPEPPVFSDHVLPNSSLTLSSVSLLAIKMNGSISTAKAFARSVAL
jgi:hypothetical protein